MAETRLEVIYSVTSTTYTTQLFNVTGNFVKAELGDGTQLPDSIFSQENKAYLFDETGLTSVFYTLCGNTLVGEEFQGMTRIVGVNVPSTVTSIPERCFRNCSILSDAYITSSVTNIASGAFENTAIEFFEIPATSVTIGDRVFAGCSALTAITMNAPTAPSVSQHTFYQVHTGGTLTYPSGSDYSSWLSNNEYYLGYYGWTGVTPQPQVSFYLSPTAITVPSGQTSASFGLTVSPESGVMDASYISVSTSNQAFPELSYTSWSGDGITFYFNSNTGAQRTTNITVTYMDNYGITYPATVQLTQSGGETPVERYIKFNNTGATVGASSIGSSQSLKVCGCTCDISRGFEIISLQGNFQVSADTITGSSSFLTARFVFERNSGTTQLESSATCRFYDTSGNSYDSTIRLRQKANAYSYIEPQTVEISHSAQTVCANITSVHYTDPYYVVYRVQGGSNWGGVYPTPVINGNQICVDMPENTSGGSKYLDISIETCGTTSYSLPESIAGLTIRQSGTPVQKDIRLYPNYQTASSGAQTAHAEIATTACSFSSFTITEVGGDQFVIGNPYVNGNRMCFDIPENTGQTRTQTFSMQLFDTDGDAYSFFFMLTQEPKGTSGNVPDPWSDTGDTAYTWYKDDSLLRVLPPTKILADTEVIAYWPVTAHTFNDVGVRASGDVVFTYELLEDGSPEYNSHSLYAYTEDNTGTTQQVSTIKLVAFSGTSAYSASTVLMKNPDSHGWITASPNPVNAASLQNSVNVYLTLTNCQRNINKEATDNVEFDEATWVTVTRVNNTTLTFNFQANSSPQLRATYYYAYALDDSGNNVYCRIDLIQEGNNMGISITPDRTSLGKAAGSFTARVESTESGNFSFSASSWMVITSYVPESQYGGTLYIDYYENNNEWPRTGDIIATQQISKAPYTLSAKTQISQTNTADTAFIRVTPSSISVDRTAGVVEAQVSYGGLATVPELVQNDGNMSIVSYDLDSNLITVVYGANDTSMDKYKNFTVTAISTNGNVIEAAFSISQGGTGLPVAPIWRDYVLTLPTPGQGYINYNISYDGTIVYTGRAYGMGQDNIKLYYNHICKPFLSNHIDFTEGYQSIRDWLGNFIITSPELGDITSVSFFEDYSYENREIHNVMSLNNPITNEVVEGSYVPFSFFITGASGNVTIRQNGQQLTGLTINDNEQHRYFIDAQTGKTYSCQGVNYRTIKTCEARYSLYYVNSYGGVDVLPFRGKSFKKTDNITRLNYSRSFRNNTLEFENVNYMNEIKPVWELNTHYMVDEQSKKMHELVESTCVYLYDALEQTYTPVVITDKKLEYKTYFNQGRKFYTYTINVEESQSRERR